MGQKILIDTNIAIGYIGNRLSAKTMDKLDPIFDAEYHISSDINCFLKAGWNSHELY